jgi:Uma2 family endonuclease
MTTIAKEARHLSVAQYLEGELTSEVKHQYVGGQVYAMIEVSVAHILISANLLAALRRHLRAGPCQVFMSDVKVRLKVAEEEVFYYMDVFVACQEDDRETYYRRFPNTVIEVLSEATERTDRREKFLAYQTIGSLQEYALAAQDAPRVTVFRRENAWRAEHPEPVDALRLPSLDFAMPVAEVYEGVAFA